MSVRVRYFLFEADGKIRRISKKLMDELIYGENALPEYAGQTLRMLTATVDFEDKKPVRLARMRGFIYAFDDDGKVDQHVLESVRLAMESTPSVLDRLKPEDEKKVVSIGQHLSRKEYDEKHVWEPGPKEINLVIGLIWPDQTQGEKPEAAYVAPVKRTKPPVPREAREALGKIAGHTFGIQHSIEDLSEKSLVGLIAECQENAQDDRDTPPGLWEGIAVAAEHRLKVLRARRTKKGVWYALIEAMVYRDSTHAVARMDEIEWKKCDGRDAAVATARELLRNHADLVNEITSVEAHLYPEIEWTPLP